MRNFNFIGSIDPVPLLIELNRQPELWNVHKARRAYDDSPHAQTDDIWARWIEEDELDNGQPRELKLLGAWHRLPALRPIVFAVMTKVQAVELGAVFLTRIPPGKSVLAHKDFGWHATRYNTKVYVALQSNEDCVNAAEGESVVMKSGECWVFRNTVPHSVSNCGLDDRISAIISTRCE